MAESDAANMPDGRDLLRTMGWEPLPFSCLGLVRKTGDVKGNNIWSWIVLVPWLGGEAVDRWHRDRAGINEDRERRAL